MSELETEQKPKKKIRKKWIVLLVAAVIAAVGAGGWYYWKSQQDEVSDYWFDKAAKDGMIEGRTEKEIQEILNTVVQEGMFNVSVNPNPSFKNGKSEGNLCIENIKANHYYARVVLTLDETGEEVFESKGLKPGQYIENVKLSKNLKKGIYPATAQFIITDPETLKDIGKVNTQVTLNILN